MLVSQQLKICKLNVSEKVTSIPNENIGIHHLQINFYVAHEHLTLLVVVLQYVFSPSYSYAISLPSQHVDVLSFFSNSFPPLLSL